MAEGRQSLAKTGEWDDVNGPRPSEPGCRVPAYLLGRVADAQSIAPDFPPGVATVEIIATRSSNTNIAGRTVPPASSNPDSKSDGWPDVDLAVLRLHRREPPVLPLEVFGERWATWITNAARAAACPVDYVVAPLLASASVVIGHARWAQAAEGWAEPPHLWCGSVGDSGDGKSPGADMLYRSVLPEIERRMAADFPDQLREAQSAIEAAKARRESWKDDLRKALKEGLTIPPPPSDEPEA